MSLHGLPEAYGGAMPVGFAQPSGSYHYQTPHTSLYDPNTFRQFYASHLATLTFNSRPIIQNLSMIAQDYSRMSSVVVQCLEAHIRRVGPNIKLPAWYLLDAISKNVPVPYAGLFAPMVAELFLDSYYQVDLSTRSKMEEMLMTWRDGGQHGREVFGVVPQVAIERAIWQSSSSSRAAIPRPNSASRSTATQISKAQVLADLEVTLAQQQRSLQSNPYDPTATQHVEVLQQLRTVVQTTHVKQQELVAIDKQLRQMSQAATITVPPESSPHQLYSSSGLPSSKPAYAPPSQPLFPPSMPSQYASSSVDYPVQEAYPYSQPGPSQTPKPLPFLPPAQSTAGAFTSDPVGVPSANIADLFNSLLKAGIVSTTGAPGSSSIPTSMEDTKVIDLGRQSAQEYERNIMGISITLTTSDLTKHRSGIVPFLYERMPIQCKQCAIRYPEGQVGKKQMEDHLDMHFRQNQKASQNVGRGHCRSWFVGAADWVNDVAVDAKGKRRADGSSAKEAAAAAAAEHEAKLRESYVVVPTGDEAKSIQCPICKEVLKSEFLEDDEDWVWMNAVRVQGRIYHATCHAETSTANSLASRLRHEAAAAERSRSGTPEVAGVRSTPPGTIAVSSLKAEVKRSMSPETRLIGMKRKVEDVDNAQVEGDETPPSKRVALSIHN
ncbi:hypothetical protein JB92DRAFT_2877529 [Gautieria morchelliformis]|nr:hypothetical protein JB92DRAFT_2877529 [Gautieria morchelliformis]